jgi:hypothetical protein
MTSAINTGTINVNYPNPGVNNSSQGFRDNFAGTKNNLDIAQTELSDLRNKVLVKAALTGTVMNNDMNNGIISNVQTLAFRASTYNLGTNLSGTVTIDCSLADVHIGTISTITPNTSISLAFTKWLPPAGTLGKVEVILNVVAGQQIGIPTGPPGVVYGLDTIEGYSNGNITVPAGVTSLNYIFSTEDCGSKIGIMPVDRPRQTTQIQQRAPAVANLSATGTITASTATTTVTGVGTAFNTELVVGRVILTTANVVLGTVASIASSTSLTLTTNSSTNVTGVTYRRQMPVGSLGDRYGATTTDGTYLYVCTANYDGSTAIWKRIPLTAY